jgi:hypothetical protein
MALVVAAAEAVGLTNIRLRKQQSADGFTRQSLQVTQGSREGLLVSSAAPKRLTRAGREVWFRSVRNGVFRVVLSVRDAAAGELPLQCYLWMLAHLWHSVPEAKRPADNAGWRQLAEAVAAAGP